MVIVMVINGDLPAGNLTAMEHGHKTSGFSHTTTVIFYSYVKLPEGNQQFAIEDGHI